MKGILFDLDGTLTDYRSSAETGLRYAAREMARAGISIPFRALFQRYQRIIEDEIPETSRTGIPVPAEQNRVRRFEKLLSSFDIDPAPELLKRMAEAYGRGRSDGARLFPFVRETLAALSEAYILGLVTEGSVETQSAQLQRLGLDVYFASVTISGATPFHKPALELYRIALESMGCPASETCMVGDRVDWDLMPARSLGMKTILFQPTETGDSPVSGNDFQPDRVIRSFNELAEIFLVSIPSGEDVSSCR